MVSDEEDEEDLNPFELPSGTSSDELDDDGNAADHGPAGGIANVATLDGDLSPLHLPFGAFITLVVSIVAFTGALHIGSRVSQDPRLCSPSFQNRLCQCEQHKMDHHCHDPTIPQLPRGFRAKICGRPHH